MTQCVTHTCTFALTGDQGSSGGQTLLEIMDWTGISVKPHNTDDSYIKMPSPQLLTTLHLWCFEKELQKVAWFPRHTASFWHNLDMWCMWMSGINRTVDLQFYIRMFSQSFFSVSVMKWCCHGKVLQIPSNNVGLLATAVYLFINHTVKLQNATFGRINKSLPGKQWKVGVISSKTHLCLVHSTQVFCYVSLTWSSIT